MKNIFFAFIAILLLSFVVDKPAYQLFDADGKKVTYSNMIEELKEADVIFFGELHNNPICHWLEIELAKDIYKEDSNLVIGAEMFEADNQLILDEYLSGVIKEKSYKKEAKLWPNYDTDYKPLVEFARRNRLKFIATNIPRRYASLVHMRGLEGLNELDEAAKKFMAPLPIDYDPNLGCYKKMYMMSEMGGHKPNANFPKAQAVKDASMAWFIMNNIEKDSKFIHYNGSFHSDFHEGIVWYLKKYKPNLRIKTISAVEQANIDELDKASLEQADFILAVPKSMTKTY